MFTRTRIPKHTNCVRFYGSCSSEAYRMISLFLQGEGRVANAKEIVEARVSHGFNSPFWQCYFTTTSTEWFGLNAKGRPVIVILHDKPPFFSEEGLKKVASLEKFSVISRELFLEVCAGAYGPVTEIPLSRAVEQQNENKNRYGYMTRKLCNRNQLLTARLGGKESAKAYLDIHEAGSRKEMGEHRWKRDEEDRAIIKCDLYDYFLSFTDIIEVQGYPKKVNLERSPINLEKEASVCFVGVGCLCNGKETEVNLSVLDSSSGFLAIVSDNDPTHAQRYLPMYSTGDYMKHLSDLFLPHETPANKGVFEVVAINGWYFTQRFREKIPVGDNQKEWFVTSDPTFSVVGEPKYLVKSLKPLGRRTLNIPIKRGYCTYKTIFSLFADQEANAFEVLGGFKKKGEQYTAVISYYKAEIYTDRIIPTEKEILADRKLLGRFI